MIRRLLIAVGLVLAVVGATAVYRAYQRMRPDLPAATWTRWLHTEADLTSQCSQGMPQTAAVRQQENRDMSVLVSIARAHPSATTPSGLTPQLRDPMSNDMGYVGSELSCNRPDLVAEAWRVASSLPGGYATHVTAQQEDAFIRVSDDFKNQCARGDRRSVVTARRDATRMVALDRAAPHAGLLQSLGVYTPQQNAGGTPAPWFDLRQCDHQAVAILARGVGATPAQIGG
jgi:hypothetical protein